MIDKKEFLYKRKQLLSLKKHLKRDLIGIDSVIDSVIDYIGPWHVFPEVINSPLVIDLWGTTGVGKTDLVRSISKYLNKPLIEIDMGVFDNRSEFSDIVYNSFCEYSCQFPIIVLDEFQNAKTIVNGEEIEKNYLRGVWGLLSDGKIQINRFIESKRCLIRNLKNILPPDSKDDSSNDDFSIHRTKIDISGEDDVYPEYIMESLSVIASMTYDKINSMVIENPENGHKELIEIVRNSQVITELDFSKSIIFVIGNLDDLYENAKNINPDLDIDFLHDKTKHISIPDTKLILSNYFRPEQISRLGNNHLIYPFLSEKDFKIIINKNLNSTFSRYKKQSGIIFSCDQSIKDIIYSEGVYPTQGVRPLLSTVKGIIETNCQKFIFDVCEDDIDFKNMKVILSFDNELSDIVFKVENNKKHYTYHNELKIASLRQPKMDDKHAIIAVHESGHALCYALGAGLCPTKLTAFSANADSAGFTRVYIHPDKLISKSQFFGFIVAALGGRASELEFFGDENLSTGSQSDLKAASGLAVEYVEKNVFLISDPLFTTLTNMNEDGFDYPKRNQDKENKFKEIVSSALEEARIMVRENKKFILELSSEMLKKEFLNEKDIMTVLKRNNINIVSHDSCMSILKKEAEKYNVLI